jgi:hypothetical protein
MLANDLLDIVTVRLLRRHWLIIQGSLSFSVFINIFVIFYFLAKLNQKKFCNLILGIMVEFCDNPKTSAHVNAWRGKKDLTAASLLIKLWRKEEKELGVKRDRNGKIVGECAHKCACKELRFIKSFKAGRTVGMRTRFMRFCQQDAKDFYHKL